MFPWLKLGAVAVAAAACFGAGWSANGWRLGAQLAEIKAEAEKQSATHRATEREWGKASLKIMEDSYAEAETLRAAVARANAAASGLHNASSRTATAAARDASTSPAAAATILMYAELHRELDEFAGEAARTADAARAAGIQCERFDQVTR